jgi:hypothetical protein
MLLTEKLFGSSYNTFELLSIDTDIFGLIIIVFGTMPTSSSFGLEDNELMVASRIDSIVSDKIGHFEQFMATTGRLTDHRAK